MAKSEISIKIEAPIQKVWNIITDIENSANTISGIEKIDILEKPENKLVGLKWRETRTMFGQTATEVMWITHAEEFKFYKTRAESHGSLYISGFDLFTENEHTVLKMSFTGKALSLPAKLMNFFTGWMFKKATISAIRQDLEDIKKSAEQQN